MPDRSSKWLLRVGRSPGAEPSSADGGWSLAARGWLAGCFRGSSLLGWKWISGERGTIGSVRRVCGGGGSGGGVLKPRLRFCRGLIYAQRCVAAAGARHTRREPLSNCRSFAARRQPLLSIHHSRRTNLRIGGRRSCLSRAADGGMSFCYAVVVFFPPTLRSTLKHPLREAFPAVCLPPFLLTFFSLLFLVICLSHLTFI